MMTDPIADMLTRIRNGQSARKLAVSMPASKAKEAVAKVLQDEGYIIGFETTGEGVSKQLTVELKYFEGLPVIESIQRTSRPGLRIYRRTDALTNVLGWRGVGTGSGGWYMWALRWHFSPAVDKMIGEASIGVDVDRLWSGPGQGDGFR